MQHELPDDVVRVPPVRHKGPVDDGEHLRPQRHGKLAIVSRLGVGGRLLASILDHMLNLAGALVVFGRTCPHVAPVLAVVVRVAGADGLEHVLGRVRAWRTALGAVALKVVDQRLAVLAERTVVHDPATALEQEKLVKVLEQHGRRLVDGAQDGLPGVGELPQEAHDVEGGTRVEAGRGLVEEDEQLRLARELDGDRHPLPLLLVQAGANLADGGAGDVAHLEQVDDALDVLVLLCRGHLARLTEQGREAQRLPDGGRRLVHVHLLGETGGTLERLRQRPSVDEEVASDDAKGDPLRQDVEQRRLARAGSAHERRQASRTNVALDVLQQLSLATLDGNDVVDVAPGEDGLVLCDTLRADIVVPRPVQENLVLLDVARLLVRRGRRAVLDGLGHALGRLATLEDGDGATTLVGFLPLLTDDGHEHEQGPEGDDDADVPPQMRARVVVSFADVVRSGDEGLAGTAASERAGLMLRHGVGAERDQERRHARDVGAGELVGDQSLVAVLQRVDVREPPEPRTHLVGRDEVAGVDDERLDRDAGDAGGDVEVPRQRADGAEEGVHGHRREEEHEDADEEGGRGPSQVRHPVHDDVEDEHLDEHERSVDDDLGDAVRGGTVEGEALVLQHDGTAREGRRQLGEGQEGVEEQQEEEHAAAREDAGGGVGHVEEERADDDALEDDAAPLAVQREAVAEHDLDLPLRAGEHLLVEGDGVVLLPGRLGLGGGVALAPLLGHLGVEAVEVGGVLAADVAGAVGLLEGVGGARDAVLPARTDLALVSVDDRGQELGRRAARRAVKAEALEVGLGLGGRTVVGAAALVDEHDLVEEVVQALAGLVQGDEGGDVGHVGKGAQALDVLERRARVEPPGRVVPALRAGLGDHGLGDGDALLLAAGDASDHGVADLGVQRVLDPEDLGDDAQELSHVVGPALALLARVLARGAGGEGEGEGVLDGEGGVVQIVLRVVEDVAAIALHHLGGRGAAVGDFAGHVLVAKPLVTEHLEEGRAAAAGPAQDEQHLAGPDAAVEVVQEGANGRFRAGGAPGSFCHDVLEKAWQGQQQVADSRLQGGAQAHAFDGQTSEDKADVSRLLLHRVRLTSAAEHA